jgi:ubiquinone/menaquinone biosynthesis C-methylase UbiE
MIFDSLRARAGALMYDPFLALGERRGMAAHRRALLAGVSGQVLEVGAGTGLNLPFYGPDTEVVLTEPDPAMRARAARRGATVVDARAEALPFEDGAFDAVVCTLVLCTVDDPAAAVAELRRVLRPGGRLLFIEHVRAQDARRQDRWARAWGVFAMGCRCNQPTVELLRAELDVRCELAPWRGMPSIVSPLAIGEARR